MTTDTAGQRPTLESDYPLKEEQIQDFRENGHVYLPGVASKDEVEYYRRAINDAAEKHGQVIDIPMEERNTYNKAFLQHTNLWPHNEEVRAFVLSRRFGKIAAELLGVDGVRIYHDQALFKEPGGGHTPWHQDQFYWPIDTDNTVTMWMPLVDITEDMGMLTFASRSHIDGYLGDMPISDESDAEFNRFIKEKGMSIQRQKTMNAGDATWHYGWNLHSAPGNDSDKMREVMTVIYIADGCRVTEPRNENQKSDLESWMPGLKPGDLVASDLNPCPYKA